MTRKEMKGKKIQRKEIRSHNTEWKWQIWHVLFIRYLI